MTSGLQHLQVEGGALLHPLGLEQLAVGDQLVDPRLELGLDAGDRLLQGRPRGDVVAVGIDGDRVEGGDLLAGERIDLPDRLDLVAEHRQPPCPVLHVRREHLDHVAVDPEGAAEQVDVVAPVLELDQPFEQLAALHPLAGLQADDHLRVGLDRADAVDA